MEEFNHKHLLLIIGVSAFLLVMGLIKFLGTEVKTDGQSARTSEKTALDERAKNGEFFPGGVLGFIFRMAGRDDLNHPKDQNTTEHAASPALVPAATYSPETAQSGEVTGGTTAGATNGGPLEPRGTYIPTQDTPKPLLDQNLPE